MAIRLQVLPVKLFIRRSVRYLLVSRGFIIVETLAVLAALSFVLTGSRLVRIDRFGDRADILAAIAVTALVIALLRAVNRRAMVAIDRRFFREAYNVQVILTELSEAVRAYPKIEQLIEVAATKITEALHPENIVIFLEDESSGDLIAESLPGNAAPGTGRHALATTLLLRHDASVIHRIAELSPPNTIEIREWSELVDPLAATGIKGSSVRERQTLRRIRSALLIPITSNGHLYGIISLGPRLGDLPYSNEDKQLLLTVAGQMATTIENARLIRRMTEEARLQREVEMAAEVQRRLFPAGALEDGTLQLFGTCLPARGVGGDYYDYFEVSDRLMGIAIADVAGKGISAALQMSSIQALLRCQMSSEATHLTDIVSSMNRVLQRTTVEGSYATFFLAEINEATRVMTYVNAGHNPPLLVRGAAVQPAIGRPRLHGQASRRSSGNAPFDESVIAVGGVEENPAITLLTTGGPVIGTFLDGPYEQESIQMERGDLLVAYTDGVTEAMNAEDVEFGEARLRSIIVESLSLTARELADRIIANVREWQGDAPQHDDITLIVLRVK
jgi:sigma-B regulation protein RsbU (phosphoserine phosphatase)